jgi:hypothetical protein
MDNTVMNRVSGTDKIRQKRVSDKSQGDDSPSSSWLWCQRIMGNRSSNYFKKNGRL